MSMTLFIVLLAQTFQQYYINSYCNFANEADVDGLGYIDEAGLDGLCYIDEAGLDGCLG